MRDGQSPCELLARAPRGWVALALVPTKCTGSLASPGARDRLTAAIEFVIVFLFFLVLVCSH